MIDILAQTSGVITPFVAVVVCMLTGLFTLVGHGFIVLAKSVTESQAVRIELLRSAIESFNEGMFGLLLNGIEFQRMAGSAMEEGLSLTKEQNEEIQKSINEAMKHLSLCAGRCMAINQDGVVSQIRALTSWAMPAFSDLQESKSIGDLDRETSTFMSGVVTRRLEISEIFSRQLRQESLLSTAFRSYFGS